jgi:hypothetical protein
MGQEKEDLPRYATGDEDARWRFLGQSMLPPLYFYPSFFFLLSSFSLFVVFFSYFLSGSLLVFGSVSILFLCIKICIYNTRAL